MSNPLKAIADEIQAVVDRLQQEGHTVATRLENALGHLFKHVHEGSAAIVAEVKADAEKVAAEEKPIVAEVKADVVKVAAEVKENADGLREEVVADVAKK